MGFLVVKLIGGLGNQLFQYAAGRALAAKCGLDLKLDATAFERYTLRPYMLGRYRLRAELAGPEDLKRFPGRHAGWRGKFAKLMPLFLPGGNKGVVVREQGFGFQELVLDPGRDYYLDGYWQSEKYFIGVANELRDELVPTQPPVGRNAELIKEIQGRESVCLHVRRGDYVANPQTQAFHGVLSLDYYARAVEKIRQKTVQPSYYLFSDDPAWVKDNLKLDGLCVVMDHNSPQEPQEDLRLMSACRHFIIANSSLSWWGAWLSKAQDKTVVAPLNWFGPASNLSADDLVPSSWLRC